MKRIAKWAAFTGSLLISCAMIYVAYILWPQFILHAAHTWLAFGLVIGLFVVFAALWAVVVRILKRA